MCLKKIWITEHLKRENGDWKGGIIWKIDCFRKVNDTFTYLCRLNIIMEKWIDGFKEDASDLISICLQTSAEKINSALSTSFKAPQFVDITTLMLVH